MDKLKKEIEGKERWSQVLESILLVEKSKTSNSNVALDGAKSIVENISKTILGDNGIQFENDIKFDKLVKKAIGSLWVFNKLENKDLESTKSITGSFAIIAHEIGEFRNKYGFYSHGNDLEDEKFNLYLAELSISSADVLASFLIFAHSESLKNKSRIFYEDYPDFNKYIDEQEENYPEVRQIRILPSKALFSDIEAYKSELLDFLDSKNTLITKLENTDSFIKTRAICCELLVFKSYFNRDDVKRMFLAAKRKDDINRILGHGYTKNLYSHLKNDYSFIFSEYEIEEFGELFQNASW